MGAVDAGLKESPRRGSYHAGDRLGSPPQHHSTGSLTTHSVGPEGYADWLAQKVDLLSLEKPTWKPVNQVSGQRGSGPDPQPPVGSPRLTTTSKRRPQSARYHRPAAGAWRPHAVPQSLVEPVGPAAGAWRPHAVPQSLVEPVGLYSQRTPQPPPQMMQRSPQPRHAQQFMECQLTQPEVQAATRAGSPPPQCGKACHACGRAEPAPPPSSVPCHACGLSEPQEGLDGAPPAEAEDAEASSGPPILEKLVEAVVVEETRGLGECLHLCAQRSFALRRMGFEQLHFDTRLQRFFEAGARGAVAPAMNALLMAKSLYAWREAVRQGSIFRRAGACKKSAQERAKAAVAEALANAAEVARRTRTVCVDKVATAREVLLLYTFSTWRRILLSEKAENLAHQVEESEQMNAQLGHKLMTVKEHTWKVMAQIQDSQASPAMMGILLRNWRREAKSARERRRLMDRMVDFATDADLSVAKECLTGWYTWTQGILNIKQSTVKMEDEKLAGILKCTIFSENISSDWAMAALLNTWRSLVSGRKRAEKMKVFAVETIACVSGDAITALSFAAWREMTQKLKARRHIVNTVQRDMCALDLEILHTHFQAWQMHHDFDHKMQKKQGQVSGLCLHLAATSEAALVSIVFAQWREQVHLEQIEAVHQARLQAQSGAHQARLETNHCRVVAEVTKMLANSQGLQIGLLFSSWASTVRYQAHLRAQSGAHQARLQTNHRRVVAEVSKMLANSRGLQIGLLFTGWATTVRYLREQRRHEASQTMWLLFKTQDADRALRGQIFTAWANALESDKKARFINQLRAQESAATSRAAKSEEESRCARTRARSEAIVAIQFAQEAVVSKHFAKWSRALQQAKRERHAIASRNRVVGVLASQHGYMANACFFAWRGATQAAHAAREGCVKKKLRLLASIKESLFSHEALVFAAWHNCTLCERHARALERSNTTLQDQLHGAKQEAQNRVARLEEERSRAIQRSHRQVLQSIACAQEALLTKCMSSWARAATADRSGRKAARNQHAAQQTISSLVSMQLGFLAPMCLAAWRRIAMDAKAERNAQRAQQARSVNLLAESSLALQAMCFHAWTAASNSSRSQRSLEDRSQGLEAEARRLRAALTTSRRRPQVALWRQFAKEDEVLCHLCLATWQAETAFGHGLREKEAERAALVAAQAERGTARLGAARAQQAWRLHSAVFWAWHGATTEARKRPARRRQAMAKALRIAGAADRYSLLEFFGYWRCFILQSSASKVVAERLARVRALAKERSITTAGSSHRRLGRLLVARCLASWSLYTSVVDLAKDEQRRRVRTATKDRSYMIKLRGLLLQQRLFHKWLSVCLTSPKMVAKVEVPDFRKEPPKQLVVRPASAGPSRSKGGPRALTFEVEVTPAALPAPEESKLEGSPCTENATSRMALAHHASVCDEGYRRLLAHNLQEIRDRRPAGDGPPASMTWTAWVG